MHSTGRKGVRQCQGRNDRLELKFGEKIKLVHNGTSMSAEEMYTTWNWKVGENTIKVHHIGCNGIIVGRELIKDFTGSMDYVTAIDRLLKEAHIAEV